MRYTGTFNLQLYKYFNPNFKRYTQYFTIAIKHEERIRIMRDYNNLKKAGLSLSIFFIAFRAVKVRMISIADLNI